MIEPASMVDWAQATMIAGAFATLAVLVGKGLRDEDDGAATVLEEEHEERILQEVGAR